MFEAKVKTTYLSAAVAMSEVIFHATVREVRKSHSNALIALLLNMLNTMILVFVFYIMITVLGLRSTAIRGNFLVYVMSGIFLFMTHANAMQAVAGCGGSTAPIMQHAPMNTLVAIISAALGALYIQVISMVTVLYIFHIAVEEVVIIEPVGAFAMVLLAWFSGVGVGLILLAITPWLPRFSGIVGNVYRRSNMITSGKMFLANTLPGYMLVYFTWNPLFHAIDQARGFAFINYNPHNSNLTYPIVVSVVLVVVGLMGESYSRKHVSTSWGARA